MNLIKCFFNFLWDGKPDKIKRTIAKQKILDGGIGMIDLVLFDKALKLTWLRRLLDGESKWKSIIEKIYPNIVNISKYGNQYAKNLEKEMSNPFWKDVVKHYSEFSYKYHMTAIQEGEACSFLFNDKIKIGGRTIQNREFINNNIYFIKQLKNESRFLSHREFILKYNINVNFLTYSSTISAVKKYLTNLKADDSNKKFLYQPALATIINTKKGASEIYQAMLTPEPRQKGFEKWHAITAITKEDWQSSLNLLKKSTKDTKLRWFQLRLMHHVLTTNRSVAKFKREQCHLCEFCKTHSETIHHLLWKCNKVNSFWTDLAQIINIRCKHSHKFKLDEQLVLFGKSKNISTDSICDLIILMAKFYIYRCKVQGNVLNCRVFINEIFNRYCVEKLVFKDSVRFRNNWQPYMNIFRGLV